MKKQYRFHLLGLAHLPQSATYMSCAFTQKNRKLAKMLTDLGHEVFFYGSEGTDILDIANSKGLCTLITTHSLEDIRRDYGDGDNRFEIGYNWHNTDFRHDFNSDPKPSTLKFYNTVIESVRRNMKPDDFLLITQGRYQYPIDKALGLYLTVESGIGYRGSYTKFRAFESSYIQNFTYGSEHPRQSINGNHYDRVIPNYFEDEDIRFDTKKDDYYLFMGRMIKRKGIVTAYLASKARGKKLVIAGQGGKILPDGSLTATTDPDFVIPKGDWEYVGYADLETRKKLMSKARVFFAPTEYLECFAGTHIESMLSGTPVLTTDFGVFPQTVIDGVNGFRCHTLQDFVDNAVKAETLDPAKVRASAIKYTTSEVARLYQKWFDDLHNVWESTQDENVKGWHRLR